jgi:hypothetical protein
MDAAYLKYFLSGGASNASPADSFGGEMSGVQLQTQFYSALSYITGATISYAAGNAAGTGVLHYAVGANAFTWVPFGGAAGGAVEVTEDGEYAVFGAGGGMLCITVDFSSLPSGDESDNVDIADLPGLLFDDVSKADSFNGDTEYRCFYVKNTHGVDDFVETLLYIAAQPVPGAVSFGVNPAGVNNDAEVTANAHTEPAGISWVDVSTIETGFPLGALHPGDYIAVWLRRAIPVHNITINADSNVAVNAQVFYY